MSGPENYIVKMHNVNVLVNSYIEALGVIFVLSNFKLNACRNNEKYVEDIRTYFCDFKKSKIVSDFTKLLKFDAFKYDAPVELILCFANNIKPSEMLLKRGNMDIKTFEKVKQNFLTFYKESKFENFFKSHNKFYLNNIHEFINEIKNYNPQQYLFDFIGMNNNNLNICLMHGITTSNYGLNINGQLFCCVRPYKLSRFNDVDFAYDLPYVTSLVLHEFAHSFINPLTDKYVLEEKINKSKLKSIMEYHVYGEHYITAINETIIRAIECMYINKFFKNEYLEFKNEYIKEGFTLIDEIIEVLDDFVSKRETCESIETIYRVLLNIFYK